MQAGEEDPNRFLRIRHTITSVMSSWPPNTDYGKAFRNMSHEERLAEVELANNGSDEVNDDGENVNEEQKATEAKKSDKEEADDTNDDDENYEGE